MFWTENLNELTIPVLIPTTNMTFDEKINTIIRLILFIGILALLIFNDTKYILLTLVLMLFSIILYNFYYEKIIMTEKYLNKNNLALIDNEVCIKPTQNNPFMNPNITDINTDNIKTCSIENDGIQKSMKNIFYSNIFRDSSDLYDKSLLERNFYTVPSTSIPNDSDILAQWLYNRGPSCKENNGYKCYNNLYNNIKLSR